MDGNGFQRPRERGYPDYGSISWNYTLLRRYGLVCRIVIEDPSCFTRDHKSEHRRATMLSWSYIFLT